MSRTGDHRALELYARAERMLAGAAAAEALPLLEEACRLLPAHGAAHHLLGKAYGQCGLMQEAERLQRRSWELDPSIGWNGFALAELLEQRQAWSEAAALYGLALERLPQEGWIREKALACRQRGLLGGEDLREGLGPQAYRLWCEQLEPRLPSALGPLEQPWLLLPAGSSGDGPLPVQGWLVLLGAGAELRPQALQALEAWLSDPSAWHADPRLQQASRLLQRPAVGPAADLLTVDEDRRNADGLRCDPWFKPAVLAESSWSTPWLGSFSAWRLSWLRHHGLGWPPVDPLERWAWIWRALALRPSHGHVPRVLVHVQAAAAPGPSRIEQAALLQAHLRAAGEAVQAVRPDPGGRDGFALEWALPAGLRCTAIVPTRDRADLLEQCLLSVEASTAGAAVALDWIVVDNGSSEPELAALLHRWRQHLGSRFQVIRDDSAFNWSLLNNRAAQASQADLLLFLNNDIEAGGRGWLEAMAAQAIRPVIGCVGAVLTYPDGTLQHAGVVIGLHGGADHAYRSLPVNHAVHRGRSAYLSDWGAVTGACLMVKRSLFQSAGGFDPALPVEFNDVDFCLRLGQLGYRHVVDPRAQLVHHESQSRDALGSRTASAALERMASRWQGRMATTAPWWPAACSQADPDGRALEL
jgi:GT2 family glycosyltransferase